MARRNIAYKFLLGNCTMAKDGIYAAWKGVRSGNTRAKLSAERGLRRLDMVRTRATRRKQSICYAQIAYGLACEC